MKITMEIVTTTTRTVDLPERCPRCHVDFADEGNLVLYELVYEWEAVRLADGAVERPDSPETERGDGFASPVGFGCNRCPWMFEIGSSHDGT